MNTSVHYKVAITVRDCLSEKIMLPRLPSKGFCVWKGNWRKTQYQKQRLCKTGERAPNGRPRRKSLVHPSSLCTILTREPWEWYLTVVPALKSVSYNRDLTWQTHCLESSQGFIKNLWQWWLTFKQCIVSSGPNGKPGCKLFSLPVMAKW